MTGGEVEAVPSNNTIINCGHQDVPANLKYRSLLMNACNGLRNFAESFRHGTVFLPWESVAPDTYSLEFVKAIVEGLDWNGVRTAVNDVAKPVHPSNTLSVKPSAV